jgi:hypothetical protein
MLSRSSKYRTQMSINSRYAMVAYFILVASRILEVKQDLSFYILSIRN